MSVYNDARFLRQSIESVLKQTFKDYEFIITDDGSTDDTSLILEEYASSDQRIKIMRQKNAGLTVSLNRMIRESCGTYIARQDSDDWSAPERFQIQVDYLNRHPEVALLGTSAYMIDERGAVLRREPVVVGSRRIQRTLRRRNVFVHGSVMIRNSIFKDNGFYYHEWRYAQDYDLFLRISERYKVENLREPLYYYRINQNAISNRYSVDQLRIGMIVSRAGKIRRDSSHGAWDKEGYARAASEIESPYLRRVLAYRVHMACGRNLLLFGRRRSAIREFIKAFISMPMPNAIYHACRALILRKPA